MEENEENTLRIDIEVGPHLVALAHQSKVNQSNRLL